jgi:hypothetical protein
LRDQRGATVDVNPARIGLIAEPGKSQISMRTTGRY